MKYKLRQYQQKAVDTGIEYFNKKTNNGALIILPTAAGKSLVIASIVKELKGKVLILSPSKEILIQNSDKILDSGITEDIGIFSASMKQKDKKRITFATIGTVINKKEEFKDIDYLIIDECHLCNAKSGMYLELIEYLDVNVLGLTATPYRMQTYTKVFGELPVTESKFLTRTIPKIFTKIIHNTDVKELYDLGYLCPIKYNLCNDINVSCLRLNTTGADYTDLSLSTFFIQNTILNRIVNGIDRLKNIRKHFLVFCSFVDEAKLIATELKKKGINTDVLSSKTKPEDRERIIKYFKLGDIKVIVNVGILTTGFDFPALDTIIMARPTKSLSLYYQIVGRGIRIHDEITNCLLVDLTNNVKEFGKIETFEIEMVGKNNNLPRLKNNEKYLTP